jgi:hypothetical protein
MTTTNARKEHSIGFGGDALNPKWDSSFRVHNWRNYISKDVAAMWHTFTDQQKIAIAEMANAMADREEWD